MINRRHLHRLLSLALLPLAFSQAGAQAPAPATVTLLNVSYDPTRELYVEFNQAFARHWKAKTGQDVVVKQSHGGSGKQTRAIIDGLDADVATLALAGDTDAKAKEFVKKLYENVPVLDTGARGSSITFAQRAQGDVFISWENEAYLAYLYSDEGQDIAGKHFYRPISPKAQAKYAKQFPKIKLFTIDQAFGGWAQAKKVHFADGGTFDQIYTSQ